MLNSITNAMHATALGIYAYLVYQGLMNNEAYYNIWILLIFLTVFILKLLGVLVHIPRIEKDRAWHNFLWIAISILIIGLNVFTLTALKAGFELFLFGVTVSSILCVLYIRSLFTGTGAFFWIALAMAFMHILCAFITEDILRIAWICLLLSSLLWILLSHVPFLLRHKFHNDVYHLALIASTYLLYSTISTGLWE